MNLLALLIGIVGWYYLFYSRSAARLGAIEEEVANRRRQRLRRTNGAVMVVLAALIYTGGSPVSTRSPQVYVTVWLTVLVLLVVIMILALLDLRLTAQLRHRRR